MKYKGAVVKNSKGELYFFVEKEDGSISNGIPITDHEKYYKDLEIYQIYCAYVQISDGTLPVSIDFAIEKNFEDIFISIEDLQMVSLSKDGGITEYPIYKIIEDGDFDTVLKEFLADENIYYVE